MTGKEALKIIKKYDDFVMVRYLMKDVLSPQTIGSPSKVEFDEAVKTIKKDLEVLDILKKYYKSNGWSNGGLIEFWGMTESQLKKVNEWLEK